MLCKLWNAAANDAVGGARKGPEGPKGISAAMMNRYDGLSKAEKKSRLAALKYALPPPLFCSPLREAVFQATCFDLWTLTCACMHSCFIPGVRVW